MEKTYFTSESVTEGHPDKVCDQIADAVLDDIIAADPSARVAVEVCATTGLVMVFGEVSSTHTPNVRDIVRDVVKDVGYDDGAMGFDYRTCSVISALNEQSPDIARGVDEASDYVGCDESDKLGAGDQGMMFGCATDETPELMPLPIVLAHALTRRLSAARKSGEIPWLRPDGKAQVTVEYRDGVPARVDVVVLSAQHADTVSQQELESVLTEKVIKKAIPAKWLDGDTKMYINPTGRFVIGGPAGDSGVTGRKIIVDTYGGYCPHGGGALSGKDPTKVDRSGLYMARYIAKNLVAAGVAHRVELQVAYAIGRARPVSVNVNTFGTGITSDDVVEKIVKEVFDLRPGAIIRQLRLDRPIYRASANYGHLGRNEFPWEKIDKVDAVKRALEKFTI